MRRAFSRARRGTRRAAAALVVGSFAAGLTPAVAAQELPPCGEDRTFDCRLPGWPDTRESRLPSLFGDPGGQVWLDDPAGDAPGDGLDILAVGLAEVDVRKAAGVRSADGLLKLGKARKAVRDGRNVLIRIVLDRAPDDVTGDHASVHVATDVDGSPRNNAPTAVTAPAHPLAGSQEVYSLTWAATTDKTRLLHSDLARGWYKDKGPFAASWAAPNVLDVLVAPRAFGDDARVVTHVAGEEGGYDTAGWGLAPIPLDGRVGLVASCIEGSVSDQPYVVRTLVENGQGLRDVEAPASWRGGARIPLEPDMRSALERVIAATDEDGDGRIGLRTWVNLFEDGVVIRQRPTLELAVDGDEALLAFELGLTRRGYDVLRELKPESTGDEVVDAWLARAATALREAIPPFRVTRRPGPVAGEGIGSCIPWIEPLPTPQAEQPPVDGAAAVEADEAAADA